MSTINRAWFFTFLFSIMCASCGNDSVDVEPYNEAGKPLNSTSDEFQPGTPGTTPDPGLAPQEPLAPGPPASPGSMAAVETWHDFIHGTDPSQVIDLRPESDFTTEHLDMAINVPFGTNFRAGLQKVDKNKIILLYDADGSQCPAAIRVMQQAGYAKVYGLAGGMSKWTSTNQGHMAGGTLNLDDLQVENFKTMTAEEFHNVMHNVRDIQILDVRSASEFNEAHITPSVNYDVGGALFAKQVETLSKNKPLLVYGRTGAQASKAAAILRQNGFQVIYELTDPFDDFKNAGYGHIEPPVAAPTKPN